MSEYEAQLMKLNLKCDEEFLLDLAQQIGIKKSLRTVYNQAEVLEFACELFVMKLMLNWVNDKNCVRSQSFNKFMVDHKTSYTKCQISFSMFY